nr:hypothetical protein [Streptococcus suis]
MMLKKLTYRALIWRLFDDSHADYGHAATILGMDWILEEYKQE